MSNVNHPAKMSMTSQPCMYSANLNSKKKSKKNASCKDCAVECCNGIYVCKKHYEASLTITTHNTIESSSSSITPSITPSITQSSSCGAILRYGKNKGNPCPNPSSCRVHKNDQTAATV